MYIRMMSVSQTLFYAILDHATPATIAKDPSIHFNDSVGELGFQRHLGGVKNKKKLHLKKHKNKGPSTTVAKHFF